KDSCQLLSNFCDLGTRGNLVSRYDAPESTRGICGRTLVFEIEAVAIHREDCAILVNRPGSELQLGLQEFLHLPFALIPLDAPQAAGALYPNELGFVEPGIVRITEALCRAAPPVPQLLSTGIRHLMRIFGDRQDANDRALLAR